MSQVQEFPVVWLQGGACSGCIVSVLNAVSPDIRQLLLEPVVPGRHVNLLFQPTIMAAAGEKAMSVLAGKEVESGFVLCVEGSVPTAHHAYCTIGELDGKELTMEEKTRELASRALAVVAVGTCASFGGIPGSAPNPTGGKGVGQVLKDAGISTPVINIPGCPPHPDWFVHTVAAVPRELPASGGFRRREVRKETRRPRLPLPTGLQGAGHLRRLPDPDVEQWGELVRGSQRPVHRVCGAGLPGPGLASLREDNRGTSPPPGLRDEVRRGGRRGAEACAR